MDKLAALLRAAQLTAHNFHNTTKGVSFFADHEFFGEAYEAYEADYDAIIERDIGLGETSFDLAAITREAAEKAAVYDPSDMAADEMCAVLLSMERLIQAECERLDPEVSIGTSNLLQGIADKSEMRVYKLKQRIK